MLDHLIINITNVRVSLNSDPNYLTRCILIYVNCNNIFIQNTNPLARKTLFGWQRIVSVSSTETMSILNFILTSIGKVIIRLSSSTWKLKYFLLRLIVMLIINFNDL